jgi:hypothetical protein
MRRSRREKFIRGIISKPTSESVNIFRPKSYLGRRSTLTQSALRKSNNQRLSALISVQNWVLKEAIPKIHFGMSHVLILNCSGKDFNRPPAGSKLPEPRIFHSP